MALKLDGKFALDPDFDPQPLKAIQTGDPKGSVVHVGQGIVLLLRNDLGPLDRLLDARVETDPHRFSGLGDVVGGCAVVCLSNTCTASSVRQRRARAVAKVIGVDSNGPRYVVLAQPKLRGADRARRESLALRLEAGLVLHVLTEPFALQCPHCANQGSLSVLESAG